MPVNRPRPAWVERLTSSGSGASPLAPASCCSKAIAWSIGGSPNRRANPKASRAAITPTIMPRTRRVPTTVNSSVAGEAEEMATVVKELVDVQALDKGRGALFGTDEIEGKQHEQ